MENNTPPPAKKTRLIIILSVVVAVASFFGIRSFIHNLHYEITDNAQIESRAVPVIARVAGYIDSLSVDDFSQVNGGQVIIKIDDSEYVLNVAQAQADLMNAEADLATAQANHSNSLANRKLASANAEVQQS